MYIYIYLLNHSHDINAASYVFITHNSGDQVLQIFADQVLGDMTRQKCELRERSRPLVHLWRWTLPMIFVIFVTLLAARASLPDPYYDNGVRYYPGTLHAIFPSFILLEIFTLLAGLAAVPFCLKAGSWHMLSIAGFLIFNWLQGLLVAWLLSMRQSRLWEERLGDACWRINNFVAAARAWMIGIEILWIQCLGLHKVWILEVASGRRSGRLKILSGLIRLLGVLLVFLVPAIVTWRIVGEDSYFEALRRLGLPSEAVLYPPIFRGRSYTCDISSHFAVQFLFCSKTVGQSHSKK